MEEGRISIGTGCESQTMKVGGEVLHLHDTQLFCFSNESMKELNLLLFLSKSPFLFYCL